MFKTCPESVEGKAIGAPGLRSKRPLRRSRLGARSVRLVREHDKGPTCLREAASTEAENAAGEPFGQTQGMLFQQPPIPH